MGKPLTGIRILDLTRLVPGPFCTMLLSDMGAEVIKIEDPDNIDQMRIQQVNEDGESFQFDALNRGKRSISIRLKDPRGQAVFKKLVKGSDIVLEGFRPGYMKRRNLCYETLKAINSKLIYCSLSGFGQTGSNRFRGGHDLTYQALAGTLLDGGNKPVLPSVLWGDLAGGSLTAAMSILAALVRVRDKEEGGFIDAPIFDGLLLLNSMGTAIASSQGRDAQRGERIVNGDLACYNVYQTNDKKYMALGSIEPIFWQAFCKLVDRPDLLPLHMDLERQDYLKKELQTIFLSKTRDEWVHFSMETDCCLEPIYSPNESIQNPHVLSRNYLYPLKSGKKVWNSPGLPPGLIGEYKDSESNLTSSTNVQSAPKFGEHTLEILKESGYTEQEISELIKDGTVSFDIITDRMQPK
ncbi:CaiB/BaiF CoA-transferase family protein [Neobacillus niacini]|uniref:CaiB/BaiF CoA transferase family protein n=1 Tax=Neobacillus niacini TaxID=86668 RepID=UPI002FFF4BE5